MKKASSQKGEEALEFALLSWLLFAIMFAIINFGILLFDKAVITNAAREGARWASVNSTTTYGNTCSTSTATTTDPCGVANTYVKNYLISFDNGTAPQTTQWTTSGTYVTGELETIQVNYTFTGVGIGFMTAFFNNTSRQLVGLSSMYHE